jgi:NAD-dependent dihydropyrimidine dehydrogenase PreA subunit/flavodoxin
MDIRNVRAAYFSANGTTRTITRTIAREAARQLETGCLDTDFTLPASRTEPLRFDPGELIILGVWVSAGRIPNLLLPYLEKTKGSGAPAVPVAVFGNRDYDDALIEMRDLLLRCGAVPVAAGAFVGEHSFSPLIAGGRPDRKDLDIAAGFGALVAEKVRDQKGTAEPVWVPGTKGSCRGYYQPLDPKGSPLSFLKAVPVTTDACIDCKLCADICPMGAIDRNDVSSVPGKCIKCCACIRRCPAGAKRFEDQGFLIHRAMLEKELKDPRVPEIYLASGPSRLSPATGRNAARSNAE